MQCNEAYNKANRMLGVLKRTIMSRNKWILVRLYKSLVRHLVEYSTVAWSSHYNKDKELIEKVQRRFTRLFPDIRQFEYPERLRRLGLWSLEERRNRADLIEVFKLVKGFSTVP